MVVVVVEEEKERVHRVTNVSQLIERARQIRGTLRNWGGARHTIHLTA